MSWWHERRGRVRRRSINVATRVRRCGCGSKRLRWFLFPTLFRLEREKWMKIGRWRVEPIPSKMFRMRRNVQMKTDGHPGRRTFVRKCGSAPSSNGRQFRVDTHVRGRHSRRSSCPLQPKYKHRGDRYPHLSLLTPVLTVKGYSCRSRDPVIYKVKGAKANIRIRTLG